MVWNEAREEGMRLWIRQLVALSFLYMRAAKWSRAFSVVLTSLSIIGGAYSIPGYGCGLVTGTVCDGLQWSGLVLGLIVSVANGLALAFDSPMKTIEYNAVAKDLLKLSRTISLELDKSIEERFDAAKFAEAQVQKYDSILDDVKLPWYVSGEQQLANISLLQSYHTTAHVGSSSRPPTVQLTDEDRNVMRKMAYEMERLGTNREFLEAEILNFNNVQ